MSYKVKLDIFEGPFDLLVYLIERAGVSIYDVNIAEITDQYIMHIETIRTVNPESAAEFMLLAATLLQIKSAMLLPGNEALTEDKEADPRDELANRIREYKKYKLRAELISQKFDDTELIYTKPGEDISVYTDAPIEYFNVEVDRFISAFRLFLEKRMRESEMRSRYERVERERMTMEVCSMRLFKQLKTYGRMEFMELIGESTDLYSIVVNFVTVLEMMSRHMLIVEQEENFDMIYIKLRDGVELDDKREDDNEIA